MQRVKVLTKGQVVIPAKIRKKYGIQPGVEIQIFEYGNILYLVPPAKNPIDQAMGSLPATPSLSEELLVERKKDFSE